MPEWAIAIIAVVVGTILGFLLNLWRDKQQQKEKRRQEALETHFDDIRKHVIDKISEMSRSLTIRNNRFVFGSYSPVNKQYDFEQEDYYKGFAVHFPEIAQEWRRLNGEALKLQPWLEELVNQDLNIEKMQKAKSAGDTSIGERDLEKASQSYEDSNTKFNISDTNLRDNFIDFARRLAEETESIDKYQMGTIFRYNKKCPICRKF
jgi:hypothetical protein